MKINKSYKGLLIMVFLAFGSFVFFNPLITANAGEIQEIQAGHTIWYTVDQFTALDDLIPVDEVDGGSITGTFVGSQIYVKVLKVGEDRVSYYDGTSVVTETVPTVDLATGAILGSSITLHVPSDDGFEDIVLPAGAGLPFPLQFATTSVINVTDVPNSVLPLPLILNDDWAMHEAVMNELDASVTSIGGSMTVTNDAAEFGVDLQFVNVTDSVDIAASWSKADGLLQSVELHVDVEEVTLDIKLVLEKKEFKPLILDVGDKWTLSIDDIGFKYSLANFDAVTQAEFATGADETLAQLDTLKNQVLLDLTVREIDGLYYRVTGTTWDGDSDAMIPIDNNVWLTGFGTLNYQLPRIAVGSGNNDFLMNEANLKRIFSGPGFAVTEDWDIYGAFDFSISAVVEGYESLLVDALTNQANQTDVSASVSMSYTGREKNGGYEVVASTTFDATGPAGDDQPGVTITIHEKSEGRMVYDNNGALKLLQLTASGSAKLSSGETITISNAIVKLGVEYVTVETREAPPDDGGEGPIPGLDVPGFDLYIALISIFSLVVFLRRRNY